MWHSRAQRDRQNHSSTQPNTTATLTSCRPSTGCRHMAPAAWLLQYVGCKDTSLAFRGRVVEIWLSFRRKFVYQVKLLRCWTPSDFVKCKTTQQLKKAGGHLYSWNTKLTVDEPALFTVPAVFKMRMTQIYSAVRKMRRYTMSIVLLSERHPSTL